MVFIDTRLPFGASSSVTSCVRVTNYMRDIMRELLLGQPGTCAAYIDDFAIVGQRTTYRYRQMDDGVSSRSTVRRER